MEKLYDWIGDISVYVIVMDVMLHLVPGNEYKKYIRFISGLILILMISLPIFNMLQMKRSFSEELAEKEEMFQKELMERIEQAERWEWKPIEPVQIGGSVDDGEKSAGKTSE